MILRHANPLAARIDSGSGGRAPGGAAARTSRGDGGRGRNSHLGCRGCCRCLQATTSAGDLLEPCNYHGQCLVLTEDELTEGLHSAEAADACLVLFIGQLMDLKPGIEIQLTSLQGNRCRG